MFIVVLLNRPVLPFSILGSFTNRNHSKLKSCLLCKFVDAEQKVLLLITSAVDIPSVPADLFAKFQTSFYSSPEDAVIKL